MDPQQEVPPPPAAGKPPRWIWIAAGASALIIAAGIATAVAIGSHKPAPVEDIGLDRLAQRDPEGAEACRSVQLWLTGAVRDPATGKPYDQMAAGGAAAPHARKATSSSIKATFFLLPTAAVIGHDIPMTNPQQVHAACVGEGVKMRPYVEPS